MMVDSILGNMLGVVKHFFKMLRSPHVKTQ